LHSDEENYTTVPIHHDIWLIRHGETEWSLSGAHTSHTDLPLTENGIYYASLLAAELSEYAFSLVLTSPMRRARQTCEAAGYGKFAVVDDALCELDYGDYEGRTTAEIQRERPGWSLWRDGCPHGESFDHAAARVEAVIARAVAAEGDVALFAHGHILRILAARWLSLTPDSARLFALSTASLSTLGYERDTRVIKRWNRSVAE
jgi:probable phosphoglycerate mutase